MRPGNDCRCGFADPPAATGQGGRLLDERPHAVPEVRGRLGRRRRPFGNESGRRLVGRRRRLGALQPGRLVALRHEPQQITARGLRRLQHDDMGRFVGPQAVEVRLLPLHPVRLRAFAPTLVDADALPVLAPTRRSFVEAAGPGDPVAHPILDHARLLVEDAVGRNRQPVGVAGNRHLHLQVAARDHPGQQFERVGRLLVGRFERDAAHTPLDRVAQGLAAVDRFDLGRIEGTAHEQPHAPGIADQPLDASRRQGQRAGLEVAGQPVVAGRVLKRREVEDANEVAVLRRVLQPPLVIREHGLSRRLAARSRSVPARRCGPRRRNGGACREPRSRCWTRRSRPSARRR